MSLLNEALRKSRSKSTLNLSPGFQSVKAFQVKRPHFIWATVIILAAIICVWSFSNSRSGLSERSSAISVSPSSEQKSEAAIESSASPIKETGAVDNSSLQSNLGKPQTLQHEDKTSSIPLNEAIQHDAQNETGSRRQTISVVESRADIKTAAIVPDTMIVKPVQKDTATGKTKGKIPANKNSSSDTPAREDTVTVADSFYEKALQMHRDGHTSDAINMYREVLKYSPDHAGANYNLSSALIESSDFSGAENLLKDLLISSPDNPEIILNLAIAEIGLAKPVEAIDRLQKINTTDKELRFSTFLHLGVATGQAGKLEEALKYYNQAEEIHPDYPKLVYNMAITNDRLENYKDAVSYYKRFLATDSSSRDETEAVKQRIKVLQGYIPTAPELK